MHEIILLRHAETHAPDTHGNDRDRALTTRGEEEARQAGAWLAARGAAPDGVLVSTARRAMMTAERATAALPPAAVTRHEDAVYEATPGELLRLIDDCGANQLLLVGHNPGIEQLVALLVSGQSGDFRGMPPAGLAWIRVDGDLEPGSGTLEAFWSP